MYYWSCIIGKLLGGLCKLIEYTKAVTYTVENVGGDAKIHATAVTHLGSSQPPVFFQSKTFCAMIYLETFKVSFRCILSYPNDFVYCKVDM